MKKFLDLLLMPAKCMIKLLDSYTMEANKIAGAVFLAGVIAMLAAIIAEGIYPGAEGGHGMEAKRGYVIAGAEEFADGASATATPVVDAAPVDILTYLAHADIAAGEKLIKRCTACHTFEKGGKSGVGPNNYGVVGGQVAHSTDFAYSETLAGMKGKTWSFQELSEFLENPKAYAPGNKMAFAGLRKPEDRANLIAYLNSLSDRPLPLPKP